MLTTSYTIIVLSESISLFPTEGQLREGIPIGQGKETFFPYTWTELSAIESIWLKMTS